MKQYLESYLQEKRINTKKAFKCFAHEDGKNANAFYKNNRIKCFSCDWSGDIYDLVMLEYGYSFLQAKKFLTEKYNCTFKKKSSSEMNIYKKIVDYQENYVDIIIRLLERICKIDTTDLEAEKMLLNLSQGTLDKKYHLAAIYEHKIFHRWLDTT